jgi:hypothetical protein
MIVLTASALNTARYRYRIEAPDLPETVTSDPIKAARILFRCGVSNPLNLVEHAQNWGNVEIVPDLDGRNAEAQSSFPSAEPDRPHARELAAASD